MVPPTGTPLLAGDWVTLTSGVPIGTVAPARNVMVATSRTAGTPWMVTVTVRTRMPPKSSTIVTVNVSTPWNAVSGMYTTLLPEM
jgi:hypothetical protein